MHNQSLLFKVFIVSIFFASMLAVPSKAAGEGFKLYSWQIIQTRYTRIKYKSEMDIETFHKNISYGPARWNVSPYAEGLSNEEFYDIIREKVDAIFIKAGKILDMHKRFSPVNIHLYPDKYALSAAYKSLYQGECRIRAWYRFENNTIYLNVQDLHTGMLAHEIAHAIIDHYLTVKPPGQSAEILARYVDSHINQGFAQ